MMMNASKPDLMSLRYAPLAMLEVSKVPTCSRCIFTDERVSRTMGLSSFFTESKAREYQNRLNTANTGFPGELTDARVELPNWTLWAGTFDTATAAEEPLAAILKSGIEVDVAAGR